MASLLDTITEMETRLSEMRRQLIQGPSVRPVGSSSHPVAPSRRERIPYPYSHRPHANAIPLQTHHSYPARPSFRPSPSDRESSRPNRPSYPTVPLSSVLQPQEEVTFQVILRKEEGRLVYASLTAMVDGEQLTVTNSPLAESMVGKQSVKPGEILYQFIDALKEGGHLKRTFTVAPWKLCSVSRDGAVVTLEELRRKFLHHQNSDVDV